MTKSLSRKEDRKENLGLAMLKIDSLIRLLKWKPIVAIQN